MLRVRPPRGGARAGQGTRLNVAVRRRPAALVLFVVGRLRLLLVVLVVIAAQRVVQDLVAEAHPFSRLVAVGGATGLLAR